MLPSDAPDLVIGCTDPLTQRWLPLPVPYELQHARTFVEQTAPEIRVSGAGVVNAVRVGGRFAGVIDLKKTNWRGATTEIGYWIMPGFRGHGVAGRAARLLAAWAIGAGGMQRVEIRAATGNIGSQRSALAAGFRREGVLRSAGFTHQGRVDLVVFGRIAADD